MQQNDCVEIGYISKAHGIKGEVRAVLDVYDLSEYLKVKQLYLAKKGQPLQSYPVSRLRVHLPAKGEVILKMEGVNDRNEAEALKGNTIFFPEADLPALPEGHFYYFEVIGYQVVDVEEGPLGTIKDFADGNAQDILVMDYEGQEVLIPIAEEFVGAADHDNRTVEVNLPEGLLDLYLGRDTEEED